MTLPPATPANDRAARLFAYLAELVAMRTKVTRDVSSSPGLFWVHRLPDDPHRFVQSATADDDEEAWLRLDKPRPPVAPRCPDLCQPWLDPASLNQVDQAPILMEEIADPSWCSPVDQSPEEEVPPAPRLRLADHPEVVATWQGFVDGQWSPWQVKHRHHQLAQEAYSRLFKIYQEQLRRGEQYELRFGFGLLTWVTPRNQRLYHPLLTANVTIELEAVSGTLRVLPSVDGANLSLEQDMLEVDERPAKHIQERTREQLLEVDSPWERGKLRPLLTAYVHGMHSEAQYDDSFEPPTRMTDVPHVCFAPVLILRPRMGRSLRAALQKISDQIRTGTSLPAGIAELVARDDSRGDRLLEGVANGAAVNSADIRDPDGTLFPLPCNAEQEQIIDRLGGRTGVLVQGPPGTGKSHTITNLVCHFLAQGKRVLVTSQTPRALKVLRDKFPSEISPLAVSLLGENQEAMASLEASVQGILRNIGNTSLEQLERDINEHRQLRTAKRAELARLQDVDTEHRCNDLVPISIPSTGYRGTCQALAQQLAAEADRYGWFPAAEIKPQCPISTTQLEEILAFWAETPKDRQLLTLYLPAPGVLPSVADLTQAVERLKDVHRRKALSSAAGDSDLQRRLVQLTTAELSALRQLVVQLVTTWEGLPESLEPWHVQALKDLRQGTRLHWQQISDQTAETLARLLPAVGHLPVMNELPGGVTPHQILADAEDLHNHLASSGGLGFWWFRPKVVRRTAYLWAQYRFNGRLADSASTLAAVRDHFRMRIDVEASWDQWSAYRDPPTGSLARLATELRQVQQELLAAQEIAASSSRLADALKGLQISYPLPQSRLEATQLLDAIELATLVQEELQIENTIHDLVERLRMGIPAAPLAKFRDRLESDLRKGDVTAYQAALQRLAEFRQRQQRVKTVAALEDALLQAGAQPLVAAIQDTTAQATIRDHVSRLTEAWQWRFATNWLDQKLGQSASPDTTADRKAAEAQLASATEQLVAAKAWHGTKARLEANRGLARALVAWQTIVRKIGRTSKYAETNRRAAREQMQQCRAAIPAWIMPLHRVVEQVEMEPEVYDVVIVDEASQTGPEGLLLQYLAKQCIIVGDDKQISPEGGFIDQSQVQLLLQQHLSDDPLAATLKPQFSLFEQAAIRYGTRTTLREHFRCVPEIIRFSNDLCYQDTPLIPLRQYPPARLDPLVACRVLDGYREGRDSRVINRPEAAALVHHVLTCLGQPQYAGKSFGVVCLQGHEQARIIEHLLLEAVGPEPFKDPQRQLLCGDPYSFQGDERDVVFLSMVAASNQRFAAMTRETYRQRFNVAVSRARDQVWLFHSVDLDDLSPNCMRRKLLEYFYNPGASALTTDLSRCESQFERDVAEALLARGYRVLPQFEVAGRRIDLVVEDDRGRIAVECDGDAWHGPDRWEQDMHRQRILERCGWRFLRVRGSLFYARPNQVLVELCDSLAKQGIRPLGANDELPACNQTVVLEVSGIECLHALGKQVADKPEDTIALEFPTDNELDEGEESESHAGRAAQEMQADRYQDMEEVGARDVSSGAGPPRED